MLRCRCGEVEGRVVDASPASVNRAVCYCDDCQAYLHHLGRTDLLNAKGGTDIVQVAPARLRFEKGADRIAGLRLGPKGLFRWYTTCCKTPVGNTMKPAIPFVGIVAQAFERADEVFGPPIGAIMGRFAVGEPPPGSTKLDLRLVAHAGRNFLAWKLLGRTWPHPFFDRATQAPLKPVTVLTRSERDALRPLCGPSPTAARA